MPSKPAVKLTRKPTVKQQKIIDTKSHHPDLTSREIAAVADTDHAHVIRTLNQYGITTQLQKDYEKHQVAIMNGLQARLLSSITPQDIQNASLMQRMASFGILYDKSRIQQGLSTDIVEVRTLSVDLNKAYEQMRKVGPSDPSEPAPTVPEGGGGVE